ncbi:hypothetical protein GQ53DRAFT_306477 [Thozetella sp. PMI_491]|nr:hypothetical protein GQ53DRAFT_306477 [Thozetella sp. PMI_491]
MAFRGGGGGADRQPNRYFNRYSRPKRRLYDSTDFHDYYVSDRDSLPPDTKRARPTASDYTGAVPLLAEPRRSPSPETPIMEPEYPGRTPPPPAFISWAPVPRDPPDTKRAWPPTVSDYNGAVSFLAEQRRSPSPETPIMEPEYPGRTPPPPAFISWAPVPRDPPDTKGAWPPTVSDYNGAVSFLAEQRRSPSPETLVTEPEYPGRTPPPPAFLSWALVPRDSPDADSGSEISESIMIRRGDERFSAAPPPVAADMKRTASGLAIRSDILEPCALIRLLEDEEAANRVRDHLATFRRYNRDSKHERILRSIINPRSMAAEYPLDDASLQSIFSAANEIFFNGRLSQRVVWDWSHDSDKMFHSDVIGNTAVRTASKRGFETLIVLSAPILLNQKYSRRLLISTFLHELIHSYLFICCGFRARRGGGHTEGFHTIAKLIDDWAGPDSQLYLSKMEADLDGCFRLEGQPAPALFDHGSPPPLDVISPCSGYDEHCRNTYSPDPDHYSKDDPRWDYPRAGRPFQPGAGCPGDDFGPTYVYTDDMPPMAAPHMSLAPRSSPRY